MCPVCRQRPAEVGVLCEECRDELSSPIRISPEQVLRHGDHPTLGALVDLWGRPHALDADMHVGRQVEGPGVAVLEPSVSRLHARIQLAPAGWTVTDLGSANGTYIDDVLLETPSVIRDGDRLRFGHIAFYFIDDTTRLPEPCVNRTATLDIRIERTLAPPTAYAPAARIGHAEIDAVEESTDVGLPTMSFKLHEPTGGGGGLIEVDRKQVQLTTTQFELMALMIRRMASERHQPEIVRGFVRSSELIADLSWDTRDPSENHVKQLVRRVRRALMKSEIGDLIESRHRFGYRLRAIPRTE